MGVHRLAPRMMGCCSAWLWEVGGGGRGHTGRGGLALAPHDRCRREQAHQHNVQHEADEEVREVELDLVPELVTSLAHLGKGGARAVDGDLRADLEEEAVVIHEAVPEPRHGAREPAGEEGALQQQVRLECGALDALC